MKFATLQIASWECYAFRFLISNNYRSDTNFRQREASGISDKGNPEEIMQRKLWTQNHQDYDRQATGGLLQPRFIVKIAQGERLFGIFIYGTKNGDYV